MPKTTRGIYLKLRLDPAEAAAIRAAAAAAGLTPSAYARRNALDQASLDAIAARLAAMPTRAEIRDDLATVGKAIAASVKSAAAVKPSATANPASTRTTP